MLDTINIERMRVEHIRTIAKLEKRCFSQPWSETSLKEQLTNPHAYFFVAAIGGDIAGYLGLTAVLDEASMCNIAVFPSFRRRGVASALLRHLDDWAAKHGMSYVTLEVRASNQPAIHLYEAFGYRPVGRRRNFYTAPLEDALLYTKRYKGETE